MKRGFTLIEMVVVLAVIAILAAILIPAVEKNIEDAKIARANNEVQVIAAAMTSFYKDTGRWPTWNGSSGTSNGIHLLYSSQGDVPDGNDSLPGDGGWPWRTVWWANPSQEIDTFENQLISNSLGGISSYSTTGENAWKGPYLTTVKPDPWGDYYASNVSGFWYDRNAAVMVWSAGPDKQIDTGFWQSRTFAQEGEYDIAVRI